MSPPFNNRAPDLLQGRRLELSLPASPPPIRSAVRLLMTGAAVGAVVVAIPLAAQVLFAMREQSLHSVVVQFAPVEQEVRRDRATLATITKQTQSLQQNTAQITSQLVSVRSGSAFLEQLLRTTPSAISLQSVTVQPSEIQIRGSADAAQISGGWEQINAFALNLESLPVVPEDGAQVQKASSDDLNLIGFSLKVQLDASVKSTPDQLRDLGAEGLLRRYSLLKQRGLPL